MSQVNVKKERGKNGREGGRENMASKKFSFFPPLIGVERALSRDYYLEDQSLALSFLRVLNIPEKRRQMTSIYISVENIHFQWLE